MTMTALATISCSTKRGSITSGKQGAAVANLTGLLCTPLDPVNAEIAERAGLATPIEVYQTFIEGDLDIKNGDLLTVASVDYPIRASWDYTVWNGLSTEETIWKWLVLEEIKSS